MNRRWIIVSNRLPYQRDATTQSLTLSAGGLVTAITGIRSDVEKLWVGTCSPEELSLFDQVTPASGMACLPVPITPEDYDDYYNGFCNDVLWPLFHYQSDRVQFSHRAWSAYQKVNQEIADYIVKIATPDDMIWVHDFQLCLLPQYLKTINPLFSVGYFLHIPFPSSEIFSELAVRHEILEGILSADLVGFQDYAYLKHFCHTVQRLFGVETNLFNINYRGRNTALGVFPVSIDVEKFHHDAATRQVQKLARSYQTTEHVILGVDRLDYIKGVDLKIKAYAEFLAAYPEYHGKVTLIQIAIPTRQDVEAYMKLRATVERLVGEINGQYATPNWTPIHYLYHSVTYDELLSLYRAANFLIVTSKRDGMNLVSLEYLAAQSLEDPGVVLLSEFTGANSLLSHAVMINPWDTEKTAGKLYKAIGLSRETRRKNHAVMFNFLLHYTATDWANSFIQQLTLAQAQASDREATLIDLPAAFIATHCEMPNPQHPLVIFLDYDGTLVPLKQHPQDAVLDEKTRRCLDTLSRLPKVELVIITGRDKQFIMDCLKGISVNVAAEHGAMFFDQHQAQWRNLTISDQTVWYENTARIMADYERQVPGSFVEKKAFCLCWHYRNSPSRFAEYQALKLSEQLENGLAHLPVRIIRGKKIIEVCAVEANKGIFVHWYLDSHEGYRQVLALGDDRTDEDIFSELAPVNAMTVKVGEGATSAAYRLPSQSRVLPYLDALLQWLRQGS